MSVSHCAMGGLYRMICGDPEAVPAIDGLVPDDTDLHAERFTRFQGEGVLEDRVGKSIDRVVFISYEGTSRWAGVWSRGQLERTFRVVVRIGYFFGDHEDLTYQAMADDEHAIAKYIRKDSNWPQCSSGCINGFVPKSSSVTRVKPDRAINEIVVEVTVTA